MTHLTLERLDDGLQYHFRPAGTCNGRPIYRFTDAREVMIFWDANQGWIARDPARGVVAGRGPCDDGDRPPEGLWSGRARESRVAFRLTLAG